MKYNDRRLVGLDVLRWIGRLPDRLMVFYDMFGHQAHGDSTSWFPCWSDAEIATVVGWMNPDGTPKAASIRQARTRLVQAGLLEKVEDRQQGRIFYTYRPAAGCKGLLGDEALAALSTKIPSVTFCRPGERGIMELEARIENLPNIVVTGLKGMQHWFDVLSDLMDLLDPEVLNFWEFKAAKALDGRDHPLRDIQDADLRLQVALITLDSIITRNLTSNPSWRPKDHVAWTLNALTRIGKEEDWKVPVDVEGVRRFVAEDGGRRTLRTRAQQAIKEFRTSLRPAAGPGPGLPDPVEKAKQRHDVAARRRGSPAGGSIKIHGGFRQFGFGTEHEPAGDALRWDALVNSGGQAGGLSTCEPVEQDLGEDAVELGDALDGDLAGTPRPDDPDVLDGEAASDAVSARTAASAPMDLWDFFDDEDEVALKTRRAG